MNKGDTETSPIQRQRATPARYIADMEAVTMRRILAGLFMAGMLAAGARAQEPRDKLEVQLQAAMRRETVDGDLKGAASEYQKIAARAGSNRDVAARALLRLGQCYRKQGDAQARKTFEQIVREYGDQAQTAAEARAQLAVLGVGAAATARGSVLSVRRLWELPGYSWWHGISSDGRLVVVVKAIDSQVNVHDLKSGETRILGSFKDFHPGSFHISPDGKWIAFAGMGRSIMLPGELRVMRSDNGQTTTIFKAEGQGAVFPYAWTPDSRQILCAVDVPPSASGQARRDVVLIPAAGGEPKRIKQDVDRNTWLDGLREGQHFFPSFSPDGRYIAYSGPARVGVRVLSSDGKTDTQISTGSGWRETVLGWPRDSEHLLILSTRSGDVGVYRYRLHEGRALGAADLVRQTGEIYPLGFNSSGDFYYREEHVPLNAYMASLDAEAGQLTTQPVRVTPRFDGLNGYPMWSPDGTKLAWFGMKKNETLNDAHLVLRDLATGNETDTELRIPATNGPSPTWLSDGRSIVVGAWEKGVQSLYKVNPATGQGAQLVRTTGPNNNQVSWSADGSKIYQVENSKSIAMRDIGSGETKVIFTDSEASFIRDITPSPDGSRIAYVSNAKNGQIKLLTPATSAVRELVNVWPAWNRRMMAWTPDGRHLIYVTEALQGRGQPTALWIVPAAGGAPKQLTQNLEGRVFDVSVSPDGKQIGFTRWAGYNEVWVMENFLPK